MIDMSCWLWETLYIVKQFHDHGKEKILLDEYGKYELCGDYMYEMSIEGICSVFSDTRNYYQENSDSEVYVFFDPSLDAFYRTCRAYERNKGISAEQNPYRKALERAINSALSFNDYSYDAYAYNDLDHKGRCRIVLALFCEFYCHHEVPAGLLAIMDALQEHTSRMERELAEIPQNTKIVVLPQKEMMDKEAA